MRARSWTPPGRWKNAARTIQKAPTQVNRAGGAGPGGSVRGAEVERQLRAGRAVQDHLDLLTAERFVHGLEAVLAGREAVDRERAVGAAQREERVLDRVHVGAHPR